MKIGYIFDEGFTIPASVSIVSLLSNNRHLDIELIILDDGIDKESKKKLTKMVSEYGNSLTFINVNEVKKHLENTTPYNWNGSYSTYIRLMLNDLLPDCDENIMMIDGDTIVDGRIDELLRIDLTNMPCAMALDSMPISYYKHSELGMNELINGGLMIINLKLWREEKIQDSIIRFLLETRSKNMLTDEDVISAILKNQIVRISPKYNFLTQYYLYSTKFYYWFFGWSKLNEFNAFYTLDELIESKNNAVIYHCIDAFTNRPWHSNNIHPYTQLYDKYLRLTPWRDEKKPFKSMNSRANIELVLRRYLPDNLSRLMYSIVLRLYYGPRAKKYYSHI